MLDPSRRSRTYPTLEKSRRSQGEARDSGKRFVASAHARGRTPCPEVCVFLGTKNSAASHGPEDWRRPIHIASAHALVASPYKSAYVAARHGLLGFTRAVALEVAKPGITRNAICPGYVLTPLVEHQIAATAKARQMSENAVVKQVLLAAHWTKRFVTVEQLAETTLFLSSKAADNMTGIALPIDGGWTAG